MMQERFINHKYLGDGVYVCKDTLIPQLWLSVNDHENRKLAMSTEELVSLMRWLREYAPRSADAMIRAGGGIVKGESE